MISVIKRHRAIFFPFVIGICVLFAVFYMTSLNNGLWRKIWFQWKTTQHKDFPLNTQEDNATCVPVVDCLYKNYAVLHQLKEGTIKPSTRQRTIYLKTKGGFGNLLYELAAMLALAKATCSKVKISSDHKLQDVFEEVPLNVISKKTFTRLTEGVPHFNLQNNRTLEEIAIRAALQEDIKLSGTFNSPRWFAGCVDDLKYKFRLKDEYIWKGREIIADLIRQRKERNVTTVGVHVYRGGKVMDHNIRLPGISFFSKAMYYFKHKYKNVLFIVTSDDRLWVKQKFQQLNEYYLDIVIAPKNRFQIDFSVLMQCNYIIQSVGAFSQWAALMNGHKSVYFKGYRGTFWPSWIPVDEY